MLTHSPSELSQTTYKHPIPSKQTGAHREISKNAKTTKKHQKRVADYRPAGNLRIFDFSD